MILLDTNVLSELMRAKPDSVVVAWIDAQPVQDLLISSITVAEILYGIARMPEGKRRQALQDVAIAMFEEDFAGRILPFDADAAVRYAELAAESDGKGKIADMADGQIAAIAKLHGVPVATRDIRHFQSFGVALINPWSG